MEVSASSQFTSDYQALTTALLLLNNSRFATFFFLLLIAPLGIWIDCWSWNPCLPMQFPTSTSQSGALSLSPPLINDFAISFCELRFLAAAASSSSLSMWKFRPPKKNPQLVLLPSSKRRRKQLLIAKFPRKSVRRKWGFSSCAVSPDAPGSSMNIELTNSARRGAKKLGDKAFLQ
ncbi:hypothetical protein C1H46_016891 [Malus baccata]|uniref:Uncharacterized protein n=1 Tax=Malus baccata TaxID=106549 RepID=A0A540MFH5_MALBA|nr:hypothetical protein C1H46_016891 [Malus baccata]